MNAKFSGDWDHAGSDNAENMIFYFGYIIIYKGFPVLRCSKFHTETALSTTEAEYIVLIQVMRDVIPLWV